MNLKDIVPKFKDVFNNLLLNQSNRSFKYHFNYYIKNIMSDNIKTITDKEVSEFKNYLIKKYNLENI